MPFSAGLAHQVSASAGCSEQRQISPGPSQALSARNEGGMLEQRRLARHCGVLEEQLERRQHALDRTAGLLDSEQLAVQEAHEALFKSEAEVAFAEGMAARKEAELRTELMSIRAEHQRERDRFRTEARRMQTSLREFQVRVKTEMEARKLATEQVDSLKEQLASARNDDHKRGREGREAKAAFATLEKQLEQYTELFKWICARCTETLGEDTVHEFHNGGSSGAEAVDGLKRIVGRTLTLLQRRSGSDDDCSRVLKENIGNVKGVAKTKKSSSEVAQRLASAQAELLNYEVQNEELVSRQRSLQDRLSESEQALDFKAGPTSGLRTEHRGRLRAAEDGQKRLQKQLAQVQDELQLQYTRHEEEHERMRSRLSALQRAKEAGERYIEAEEDAWINAQRQERSLQSEYARMRSEIQDAEADAREARDDAVEARAASQIAAATRKRLEADLEELQLAGPPVSTRSTIQDQSVSFTTEIRSEADTMERTRKELAMLREECTIFRRSNELEQEVESYRQRTVGHEQSTEELRQAVESARQESARWHEAAENVKKESADLQHAFNEQAQALHWYQATLENQQAQQARIDEAKRVMVNKAMTEQEQTLKEEMACVEGAMNERYSEAVRELQHCADEHQEQMLQLDHARKSVAHFQELTRQLEADQQQQVRDLAKQEQEVCDFGRAELTAILAEQEASMQAHVDAVSAEKTEGIIADTLAKVKAEHNEEMAHLHGAHAIAIAALQGECSGEIAAIRHLELESRNELSNARLACEAAEFAGDESVVIEEEKTRRAQQSCKEEAVAMRLQGEKLRVELRRELWDESYTKACEDILEDARRSARSEFHTSMSSTKDSPARVHGSPPACGSRRHSHKSSHGEAACSTSGTGMGASPSSIGACSTSGSSNACASSALILPQEPSKELGAFMPESEVMFLSNPGEDASFSLSRRALGASPPPLRQCSDGVLDLRERIPPTGVFRQWTAPELPRDQNGVSSGSRLSGVLPEVPQATALDMTFSSLPPLPGGLVQEYPAHSSRKTDTVPGHIPFKPSAHLPQPPPQAPSTSATSFQDQASAVLEMVSRSRAAFRANNGFPKHGQGLQSFGHLPPWPGAL